MKDFVEMPKRKWWQEPKRNEFVELLRGIRASFRGVPVSEVVGGVFFLLCFAALGWLLLALPECKW